MRDLYLILGVARDASPSAIRSAFRALAKRHHPDRAGPQGAGRFAEIRSAYETLSDAVARRAYDDELSRGDAPPAWPSPGRATSAEPLRPEGRRAAPQAWSGLEPFLAGSARTAAAGEPGAVLDGRLLISDLEAAFGTEVTLQIPVATRCPGCPRLRPWWLACPTCGGMGVLEGLITTRIAIPAGVRSGTVLGFPLGIPGSRGSQVLLRLHLWIVP